MKLVSDEDLARAREMDLLTYLTYYEPGNLKHVSGNTYSTVEHDSLIINNGKWCWFSQGIGGRSALDYLIKVRHIPFREAVERLIGQITEPLPPIQPKKEPPKVFSMPEVNINPARAIQYLVGRGIDPEIVQWCIDHKLVFETTKYSNVLFKGDVQGSDQKCAFKIVRAESPRKVHVFESVPDLLSYATLVKLSGKNWLKETYLSLAGIGGKVVPMALEQFLKDYPDISHIYLHLDNDGPGRNATKNITEILKPNYVIRDIPPPEGKDFNDYLRIFRSKPKSKNKEAIR